MKREYTNRLNKLGREAKNLLILISLLAGLYACKEQERFEIGYTDTEPPGIPGFIEAVPLYGGARIRFTVPSDEDLLSIDASYVDDRGKTVWFSVSYYQDTINVYGFSDTLVHTVNLYAVDRAGNKSESLPVPVKPLEPAYMKVAKSLIAKAGFSSFFMDWTNDLQQNLNVYADFSYTQNGEYKEHKLIHTSNVLNERWVIRDLELSGDEPISLKIRVEDYYGNITEYIDKGQIALFEDEMIPKDKWSVLEVGSYMGDIPMGFLSADEGRISYVIDGIIDDGRNMNYGNTGGIGRTGQDFDGNQQWNIMIDLGDEYELSRIITHQRYYNGGSSLRGMYYMDDNVGTYKMYLWDSEAERWDSINRHTIPLVEGLSDMEYRQMGIAGDMAYCIPDNPQFTRPTRWFRYESLYPFGTTQFSWLNRDRCISEITLYGRKANR
jgi:hypothetical protein